MISFDMGSGNSNVQEKVPETFQGYVECPVFSEDCSISLEKNHIVLAGRFRHLEVMYGEIITIHLTAYQLTLMTDSGQITISRMGQKLQWLYQKLYAAFNETVLEVFKVTGKALLELTGEYTAKEEGMLHGGPAQIRLYEDCLCILPPNENARRLPLCFLKDAVVRNYTYELQMHSGERICLSKLGRELDILDRQMTEQLHKLGKKTLEWQKEVAPDISSMQAAYVAGLMPYGRGAQFQKITEMAPSFAAAIDKQIKESRMAKTYPWLLELCGGQDFWTGILPAPKQDSLLGNMECLQDGNLELSKLSGLLNANKDESTSEVMPEKKAETVLWMLVPDKAKRIAAVELSLTENEAAATYIYRIPGAWEDFAIQIDRALEAGEFDRQLIQLSEERLRLPENLEKRMLVKRTPALELLRKQFAGRAIHTSMDRWKKDIETCCNNTCITSSEKEKVMEKHCVTCGAKLQAGVKFCGQCGTRAI